MERRFLTNEVRLEARAEGQTPLIVGYAARFYDPNDSGTEYVMDFGRSGAVHERIMPGAFTRAVAEDDVVGLFNHSPDMVLGRKSAGTLRLSVDGLGLKYEIDPPDTTVARDLLVSLKRGDVTGSSFAFGVRTGGQTWRDAEVNGKVVKVRELTDLRLADVSPATFPAYKAASSGLRAEDLEAVRKELEAREQEAVDIQVRNHARLRRARLAEIGA